MIAEAENISSHPQIQSLQSGQFASNSIYYLLQLWSRMVTSVAYLKGEGESHLDRYVPEVTQTYILSKLQSARTALRESPGEDPMENEEQLVDQLDSASPLCRYQYDRKSPGIPSEPAPHSLNSSDSEANRWQCQGCGWSSSSSG